MDLLAELAKQKAAFERKRSVGTSLPASAIEGRQPKKRALWQDEHIAKKKSSQSHTSSTAEGALRAELQEQEDFSRSERALKLKAAKYEQMRRKGTDMLLTERDAENLMVDFDRKHYEGHSEEERVSNASQDQDLEDPMVEIVDEFGRTRTLRQSETLAHAQEETYGAKPQAPANLIYGAHMQHFDVDSKRKDEIWEEAKRDTGETHYDPEWEIRTKGTGYINLGTGEERKERMQDLADLRDETVAVRDVPPAKLKRQQELEARRVKIQEAKAKRTVQ